MMLVVKALMLVVGAILMIVGLGLTYRFRHAVWEFTPAPSIFHTPKNETLAEFLALFLSIGVVLMGKACPASMQARVMVVLGIVGVGAALVLLFLP